MPPIKNLWLFMVSVLLALVVLGFVANRLLFLAGAEEAVGEVERVSASNGRCGGKSKYDCTKYRAVVRFMASEIEHRLDVGAGSVRGWNQPLSGADYVPGSRVPVVYNPRRPTQAYRDAFMDVWGTPLMAFLAQLGTLFGSFSERRRSV